MSAPLPDVINSAAGLAPESPVVALRAQRPDFVRYSQGSYDALIIPTDPADVSLTERAAIALRVAVLAKFAPLVAQYRRRLQEIGAEAAVIHAAESGEAPGLPRLDAILHHTTRVATDPASAQAAHLQKLRDRGLSPRDIVTLAQIIAFVSYQIRVAAGLRLMGHSA